MKSAIPHIALTALLVALSSCGITTLQAFAQTIEPEPIAPDTIVSAGGTTEIPQLFSHTPGSAQGKATTFSITDSDYKNITVTFTEETEAYIESVPKMITINTGAHTSEMQTVVVENLEPNTTYHLYTDSYENHQEKESNAEGVLSFEAALHEPRIFFLQEHKSTVFIRDNETGGDCENYGSWNTITKTCTLEESIFQTVEIAANGITLDGNGHNISGSTQTGNGLYIGNKSNVNVVDLQIGDFSYGIVVQRSNNILLERVTVANPQSTGIRILEGSDITIDTCYLFLESPFTELFVSGSNAIDVSRITQTPRNITIRNNRIQNFAGGLGVSAIDIHIEDNQITESVTQNISLSDGPAVLRNNDLEGTGLWLISSDHDIDESNTINGKPLWYRKGISDITLNGAQEEVGQVICVACTDVIIKNVSLEKLRRPIQIMESSGMTIDSVSISESENGLEIIGGGTHHILASTFEENLINLEVSGALLAEGNIIRGGNYGFRQIGVGGTTYFGNTFSESIVLMDIRNANDLLFHQNNVLYPSGFRAFHSANGNVSFDTGELGSGNFWERFAGCSDDDDDSFCDDPIRIADKDQNNTIGFDNNARKTVFAWERKGGEPAVTLLQQQKIVTNEQVQEGEKMAQTDIQLQAVATSSLGLPGTLQVELRKATESFTGIQDGGFKESSIAPSGSLFSIQFSDLELGNYKWRARAVDEEGREGEWVEFGESGTTDFSVVPLGEAAADLAKQLTFNLPQGYFWGGKGWDYYDNEFTKPSLILTGYDFKVPQPNGNELEPVQHITGVDCSGLIMWAYNRALNKHIFEAYVRYLNANDQFQEYQSKPLAREELQPGDAIFFNSDSDPDMDHVAMYVGKSEEYDVISATSRILGITTHNVSEYAILANGFTGFRRPTNARVDLEINAKSPVDLIVTDPDGNTITPTTIIESDLEYIRKASGELYYMDFVQGKDGNPEDIVFSPTVKQGQYIIKVIPEQNATPTSTYSLTFKAKEKTVTLAQDAPVSELSETTEFTVRVSGDDVEVVEEKFPEELFELLEQTAKEANIRPRLLKLRVLANIATAEYLYSRGHTSLSVLVLKNLRGLVDRREQKGISQEDSDILIALINELISLLD